MTAQAFALLVSTTAASLGVPVQVSVTNAPSAPYSLDLARSTTDTFAILKAEPPTLELLPLAVGALEVRLYWRVEGEKELVAGPPLTLTVTEPAIDSPQIADIKPPMRARAPLWPWLVGAAALAGAYAWWRRRRSNEALRAPEAAADSRPPHERALERLAALEPVWAEGRRREFYFALTDALREYFEPRFDIPATAQTTAELLRALKDAGLERAWIARVRAVLDRADLVKFADIRPEPGWGPEDLEAARACVLQSAPPPPTPEGKTAEAAQA